MLVTVFRYTYCWYQGTVLLGELHYLNLSEYHNYCRVFCRPWRRRRCQRSFQLYPVSRSRVGNFFHRKWLRLMLGSRLFDRKAVLPGGSIYVPVLNVLTTFTIMLRASGLICEDVITCPDADFARSLEDRCMPTCIISILFLILAGTLPPSCLASPFLQSRCESAGGSRSSITMKGPTNALTITHPHSSDDVENRAVPRITHQHIPPALLKRNDPLTSLLPHPSPALTERNLTHKTDHNLTLHWTKIIMISNPLNASYTFQKLYNGICQKPNNPASLQDTPRTRGRLSIVFAPLRLFSDFLPDDGMDLRAHIQQFA